MRADHSDTATMDDYLDKVAECIHAVEDITGNIQEDQFDTDSLVFAATARYLDLLIESMKHVPVDLRNQFSDIRWSHLFHLQERLHRGDDLVDPHVVWDCATRVLPRIAAELETLRNHWASAES